MPEKLGISLAKGRAMWDALTHRVSTSMSETIDAHVRLVARETKELSETVRIAEAYRARKHRRTIVAALKLTPLAGLRRAIYLAEPRASVWSAAHLPWPVVWALRFAKARVVRT